MKKLLIEWGVVIVALLVLVFAPKVGRSQFTIEFGGWKKIDENTWMRSVTGVSGRTTYTLEIHDGIYHYQVSVPCPFSHKTFTLTWRHGDTEATTPVACEGEERSIPAEALIRFFYPYPEGVPPPPPPAEIFLDDLQERVIA